MPKGMIKKHQDTDSAPAHKRLIVQVHCTRRKGYLLDCMELARLVSAHLLYFHFSYNDEFSATHESTKKVLYSLVFNGRMEVLTARY